MLSEYICPMLAALVFGDEHELSDGSPPSEDRKEHKLGGRGRKHGAEEGWMFSEVCLLAMTLGFVVG